MSEPGTNYQALAAAYAKHRRAHPGVVEAIVRAIQEHAYRDVLEVGCGSGNYLEAIGALSGVRIAGIDPSSAMLDQLATRLPSAETRIGAGESIPYPDASFDLVYSVDVIHHVTDREACFREALRVLRPGGRIVTVTDSGSDLERRVPLTSHFPETLEHERRRYPAIETLGEEMTSAGFRDLRQDAVELAYPLTDISGFRNKSYSSLHLITHDDHARGIARLEADLAKGPIEALSLYTLLSGVRETGEPGAC
jgi:SAM-dependent methyltransferase